MIEEINFIEGDSELTKPRLPICLFILLFSKAKARAHRITASVHFLIKHTKHSYKLNLFAIDELFLILSLHFAGWKAEAEFEISSTVKKIKYLSLKRLFDL